MRIAAIWMFIAAAAFLPYEFWRLLFQPGPEGAVDLKWYSDWVHRWFAGMPVYAVDKGSEYPPATFVLLWPLIGWMRFETARWMWALVSVLALAAFTALVVRESGAVTRLERWFVALIPLSMYAAGAAIGNGQLTVFVMLALLIAITVLYRPDADWRIDSIAAAAFVFALAKPSLSPPFFWILLFAPGRIRPAVLAVLGYAAFTLFAASFQHADAVSLVRESSLHAKNLINVSLTMPAGGRLRFHSVMESIGLGTMTIATALIALTLLGGWIYRHRHADRWVLMSVAAFFARAWAHHNWYDDFLIVIPMVALFRIAQRGVGGPSVPAAVLLAAMIPAMIAPGGAYLFPQPWKFAYQIAQLIIWLAALLFLLDCARRPPFRTSESA